MEAGEGMYRVNHVILSREKEDVIVVILYWTPASNPLPRLNARLAIYFINLSLSRRIGPVVF